MKKSVKNEIENVIKVLNEVRDNSSCRKPYHLLCESHCFDRRRGEYSVLLTSSLISTPVYERISGIVRMYDLMMFFTAQDNIVRIHIQ